MKVLIYDLEIKKAILGKGETKQPGTLYCDGWDDKANMGISTLCCYDYSEDRYHIFCEDNISESEVLFRECEILSGFNILNFDNPIVAHELPSLTKEYLNGKSYDLFDEIRKISGKWCGLDAVIKANNLGKGKTDSGAMAPVFYQTGKIGRLVNYCLEDCRLAKLLLDKIIQGGEIVNPKNGKKYILQKP